MLVSCLRRSCSPRNGPGVLAQTDSNRISRPIRTVKSLKFDLNIIIQKSCLVCGLIFFVLIYLFMYIHCIIIEFGLISFNYLLPFKSDLFIINFDFISIYSRTLLFN